MKKTLFLFATAAIALASCSSDDTIAENMGLNAANEISFRAFKTNVTRGADADFSQVGNAFKVTAFQTGGTTTKYFANETFTKQAAGAFISEQKHYWPLDNNLDFYAWQPASLSATSDDYTSIEVTPGTTINAQPDLVYAVTRNWGKKSEGTPVAHVIDGDPEGVTINFRHAESKIAIKLENTNPNLKITVGDVKIANLRGTEKFSWNGVTDGTTSTAAASANTDGQYTTGTLTYLNGTWTSTSAQTSAYSVTMESAESYNVFDGIVAAKTLYSSAVNAKNFDMILIPQALNIGTAYPEATEGSPFANAYISVKLKIQNKPGDAYIVGGDTDPNKDANGYVEAMWPLTELTWLPGHKYTYTVNLAGGGYFPTNKEAIGTGTALDPILAGAEIKFVTVTVDAWKDETGNVYTGTPASTPVVP